MVVLQAKSAESNVSVGNKREATNWSEGAFSQSIKVKKKKRVEAEDSQEGKDQQHGQISCKSFLCILANFIAVYD